MLNIGQFFKKIQNKYTKELFLREIIQQSIQKQTGIRIPSEAISIKNNTVVVTGISQAARSHLFIKKQNILQEITTQQQIRVITDIK